MKSVQEIEAAVLELPEQEFATFARWFDVERNRKWDHQLEEHAANGKLRAFYEKLQSENKGQPEAPLNEVLDDPQFS